MNTYDVYFHKDENSNHKGLKISLQEARAYIKRSIESGDSYFGDYKGGVAAIVCNETEEVVEYHDI